MYKILLGLVFGLTSALSLNPTSVQAAQVFTLMPYSSNLKYIDSATKDTGSIMGVYGFWGIGLSNSIEFSADSTNFTALDLTKTTQQNTTFYYTYYASYATKFRLGTQSVTGDDSDTSGGMMTGLGMTYTKYGVYSFDLDLYSTNYAQYPLYDSSWTSTGNGLVVNQLTPSIAFPFAYGKYALTASANIISLSESAYNGDKVFASTSVGFGIYRMRWATTLDVISGKEAFAVRDSGFTLYNSPTVYKAGWKLGANFYYSYQTHFGLSFASRTYAETEKDATATAMTVKVKYTF